VPGAWFNAAKKTAVDEHDLFLRVLMRSLRVTVSILTMCLGRVGMHLGVVVLSLIVVVGRFPMMVRGRLVF
jgi:hypothetical protein